uniref:Vacuolar ATPase assembly protein VMA22 n=1 Tax=Graphocephala atropunctata TaxID=36148 RepID=A0A1B6L225_9HEMI
MSNLNGMPDTKLKDMEDELDDLAVRILQLMNDNIACKMNMERAVRSGCLDLAKTRYILSNTNSVSATKIPTEDLTATTTVVSSQLEEGKSVYELKRETPVKDSENKSKNTNQDPLKWFGFLVPTNLRQGQSWFLRAIDYSVQSANISVDMSVSLDKYSKLINDKNSLKSEIKES